MVFVKPIWNGEYPSSSVEQIHAIYYDSPGVSLAASSYQFGQPALQDDNSGSNGISSTVIVRSQFPESWIWETIDLEDG